MQKIILTLTAIFTCATTFAHTINWYMDGNTYATTQCETGSDIILPQTPYKYGYTFQGWDGYVPVEYLESTGTQYIDTGFAFDDVLRPNIFTLDFTIAIIKNITGSNVPPGFSGAGSYVMKTEHFAWNNPNCVGMYSYNGNSLVGSVCNLIPYESYNFRYEFNQSAGTLIRYSSLGEETTTYTYNSLLPTSNANIYLFKTNGATSGQPIRIYRWIYESNGVKIRDFIPVLDMNGTPCMFDKVEQKFYYNQGTGDFIAGPVIGGRII